MILILSGKQGSGKTTLQKLVSNKLSEQGFAVHIINFADQIYKYHNYLRADMEALGFKDPNPVKNGPLLQYLGTNWGRTTYGENVWVDVLKRKLRMIHDNGKTVFIIGDCRFRNEFDGFPEALRVRLECTRDVRKARCSMWRDDESHQSEVDLDQYAADGLFDLYLNTSIYGPEHGENLIIDQLKRNSWVEKRKAV